MNHSTVPSLVPFDGSSLYKSTHHHYCGFYSLFILAPIIDDTVVVDGKQYKLSEENAIDWAYDGTDTIITEKRLLYTEHPLEPNTLIYNVNHEIVGILLRYMVTKDGEYCYAIQDGFKLYNNHLTDTNIVVREKKKLIVYADQQFDTKEDLMKYLKEGKKSAGRGAILYHKGGRDAQLVLYENGRNLSNSHLRRRVFGVL
ncbi:ORF57 [Agrotis segetum granulovirus]|uniref:ORF57 n=1 Tax=Agrotis segetum granulosis virus TaxID=10464 RepID=Q6QXK0_GVAS|nr:hypothetical protein AsGV069 [Agrotis segetum granulovirus]AAS82681.1 ORF57 [Agrotis segetum granulovirus]AHN92108.1 hypothetical protein AsGV069 [Agrotis segetum granulovirus]AKN63343.1 hypothetical protein AsGV069 [Agrotis segetum granulovirus]